MIRRDRFGEFRDGRIAVTHFKIAEHLIVSPILFDDINDVLDFLSKFGDEWIGISCAKQIKAVILGGTAGQPFKFGSRRHRQGHQAGLFKRIHILIGSLGAIRDTLGSDVTPTVARVWTGDALAIHHI